jgi:hypothetical protein
MKATTTADFSSASPFYKRFKVSLLLFSLFISTYSIAIAPSLTPAIWLYVSIALTSHFPVPIHLKSIISLFLFAFHSSLQSVAHQYSLTPIMYKTPIVAAMYLSTLVQPHQYRFLPFPSCVLLPALNVGPCLLHPRASLFLLCNLSIKVSHFL